MQLFETVSFHIIKPCNMKCKFCYAKFEDFKVSNQLTLDESMLIIKKLKDAGVQKITFAGGEPLLYKYLDQCIIYAKSLGITTSIITNGSRIKEQWLIDMKPYLDWIGLSIDSLNHSVNKNIGRVAKTTDISFDYNVIVNLIKKYNYKLKINTVVNAYNKDEDINQFISTSNPDRWKVFQALRIEEQNDQEFDEIKVSDEEFENYVARHAKQTSIVPESNTLMTSSYLLVDPLGRLFENTKGKHTYSESLLTHDIAKCLSQIELSREAFLERGGIYNW